MQPSEEIVQADMLTLGLTVVPGKTMERSFSDAVFALCEHHCFRDLDVRRMERILRGAAKIVGGHR